MGGGEENVWLQGGGGAEVSGGVWLGRCHDARVCVCVGVRVLTQLIQLMCCTVALLLPPPPPPPLQRQPPQPRLLVGG